MASDQVPGRGVAELVQGDAQQQQRRRAPPDQAPRLRGRPQSGATITDRATARAPKTMAP